MFDKYNRNINYLRISVTDKCNLRCSYCMPIGGVNLISHKEILSFEEIYNVVSVGTKLGIDKVRITGGEPLVRKGIVELVGMLSSIPAITDLSMTTNGALLDRFSKPLAKAGLDRVNVSLDTMDASKFKEITRTGELSDTLKGIEAARNAGLYPIKVNCVVKESPLEPDALGVGRFCMEQGLQVRYIKEMDLGKGIFSKVIGGEGGDCIKCNRLRLTADGKIKPCLFSNLAYDIRELGTKDALSLAIGNKPESGSLNTENRFSNIGG
ncbi:MAG: radical SAM protein [Chlorobi bacterium]|nr:radical SAM protein [Chlorobiota bacterium]